MEKEEYEAQIKALKEEKLKHELYGWWLFFKNGD